jgi:Ca-activated chloride channel family protein
MVDTRAIGGWFKQSELEGRRKSITVGPGNAAMVIKNGVYGEPHIEEKVYTKGLLPNPFSTHDVEVLKVDLTPFAITFELNNLQTEQQDPNSTRFPLPLLSKDGKLVVGHVQLTLQVDRERPHLLFRLRQNRSRITPDHIAYAIRDLFLSSVIATNLAEIDSIDLKGTKEHFETLYEDARLQLEQYLRAYGLLLVGFAPTLIPDDAIPEPGTVLPPVDPPPPPDPVPAGDGFRVPRRLLVYAAVFAAAWFFYFPTPTICDGVNLPGCDSDPANVEPTPVGIGPPPGGAIIVDHWATGHFFFEGGFQEMAARFNTEEHRTVSGERIWVRMSNNPSAIQARDLLSRVRDGIALPYRCCDPGGPEPHPNPTIVTPSSIHWLFDTNYQLALAGKPNAVDTESAESLALTYIGIVTYRDMAKCLGWPEKHIGFEDILALRDNPDGWGADEYKGCASAEWGTKPLVAFTDPKESSTGRSVLLALYAIAAEKDPGDLTREDITDPKVVKYVTEFQDLIDHYMIGTSVLLTKLNQGPRFGHFLLMPEDNLIQLKEGNARVFVNGKRVNVPPNDQPMVMIYPKEGALVRSNCACIVNAPWVSDLQREGAEKWIDFLKQEEQQRELMKHGFRPATDLVLDPSDPDNRVRDEYGLNPATPDPILEVSRIKPEVGALIDESWIDVKRPGIVTFVVDTSGSMTGTKLDQAKDGLIRALNAMADNNKVGLIPFGSEVGVPVRPERLDESRGVLGDAVFELRASGQTAMYDAIKAGVELTDSVDGADNAIRAVVVLTDGKSNRGDLGLDDIIEMSTIDEKQVTEFPGTDNGPDPIYKDRDSSLKSTSVDNVLGEYLKLETENEIQIFFIGIGDDPDLGIGGLLAGATDAEFIGVAEEDLAEVLGEFSGYF